MQQNCIYVMKCPTYAPLLVQECRVRRPSLLLLLLFAVSSRAASATPAGLPRTMCGRWDSHLVLRLRGTVSEGGLSGRMDLVLDPQTGRHAEHFHYGIFSTGSGYDGSLSWLQDKSGASHALNADFARRLAITDAWLARRGWCRRRTDAAQIHRVDRDRDRKSEVWSVVPEGGAPVELRFDPKTGLLQQSTEQLSESRMVRSFGEWRRLHKGPWIAFTEQRAYPEDESTTTLNVQTARLSANSQAASFKMPPLPNDHAINGSSSTTIRYEDDDRTRVYIPVSINGSAPLTFELDSGGHLILTGETAAALGMTGVGHLSSNGSHGVMKAGYVRLDELRIGGAVLRNQPAKVLPLPASSSDRGNRPARAGIIGLELFERFAVAIDRQSKTVTLSVPRGGAQFAGNRFKLEFVEDAPFIETRYAGNPGEFMLDTGNAGRTVIEHNWAVERGLISRLKDGLKVGGAFFRCDALRIGQYNLPHEIVGYYGPATSGSESTHAAAGIFGEPTLSRFNATYDYFNGNIWLNPAAGVGTKGFDRSGLVLTKDLGQPFVVNEVVNSSPAAAARLVPGDKIVAMNGKRATTMSRADAGVILSGLAKAVNLEVVSQDGTTRTIRLPLRDMLPCDSGAIP